MKEFWTVFKVQLNVNFGFSALVYRFRKEKDKIPQTLLIAVSLAIAIGGLVLLYSLLMGAIYASGAAAGNPQIVLVMAILGLQLFLLITGIFYVIGVFYYSKDLNALAPMPLKPWQVLGSKFAVVMAYEYLMALPILLPPMLIYGIGQGAGIFYWLKAALLIIMSPAIPMMLSSLIAIVLMRFLNIGRRKDLLAIIGGTLATLGILAFNLLTQRFAASSVADPDAISRLLADQSKFISTIGAAFPPSAWATLALSQSGFTSILYLLLYIALSAGLLAAMLWLASRIYYRSALELDETGKTGKAKNRSGKLEYGAQASPVRSLFMKEMKLLLRTPAFAMNCLVGSLIIPIIIPISMLQNEKSSLGIKELIMNPTNSLYVTLGAVALMMFVSIINVTASTALSREGKTFWMSRMIPVPPHRQVYAKFLVSMAVAGAGLLLSAVMLVFFLNFDPYRAVLALIFGLLGSIPVTIVNMLPDLIKPKLSWTNPYEAVKQNMNVLVSMLGACLLIGVEVLAVVLMIVADLPEWAVYLALTVLFSALSLAGAKVLALMSGRYYKLEV